MPGTIRDLASPWNDRQNALFDRQSNLMIAHVVANDEFLPIIDEPTVK